MEAAEVCAECVNLLVSCREFLLEDEPNVGKGWGCVWGRDGLDWLTRLGRYGMRLGVGCRELGV